MTGVSVPPRVELRARRLVREDRRRGGRDPGRRRPVDRHRPALTIAGVRWPASGGLAWTQGAYNTTPDLSVPLQELVDSQAGLAAGSHVQLWVRASQTSDGDLATPDFKMPGYISHPARLTITWCQ
jgi:hypothetical protein